MNTKKLPEFWVPRVRWTRGMPPAWVVLVMLFIPLFWPVLAILGFGLVAGAIGLLVIVTAVNIVIGAYILTLCAWRAWVTVSHRYETVTVVNLSEARLRARHTATPAPPPDPGGEFVGSEDLGGEAERLRETLTMR